MFIGVHLLCRENFRSTANVNRSWVAVCARDDTAIQRPESGRCAGAVRRADPTRDVRSLWIDDPSDGRREETT